MATRCAAGGAGWKGCAADTGAPRTTGRRAGPAVTGVGMSVADVHAVLDALAGVRCRAWVGGGWGVDALAGRQTRSHRDLDLAIDADREAAALAALADLGYRVETDWRPVRVEVAAPGERWVDLHPVAIDDDGNGVQAGLHGATFLYPADGVVTGRIGGRAVECLSVAQQVLFHSGYPLTDRDRADVAVLQALARDGAAAHS